MIGDEKTLNKIDRKKISSKFNEIYSPNNMILCVVGDCDFKKLVDFAEKKFKGPKKEIPSFEIKLKNETKIFERAGVDQANLVFSYHLPLASDKKNYAARVLGIVMAGGMSSRLFSEIREKRNLAYGIKEESDISLDFSYGLIYVGTTKENVAKVKKLILKEFKDVADNLTEKELRGVKEQIIGNHQISMEDSVGQMENLLHFESNGNAREYYDFEKNISSVKLKDVKDIAKSIFKKNSFVALIPKNN